MKTITIEKVLEISKAINSQLNRIEVIKELLEAIRKEILDISEIGFFVYENELLRGYAGINCSKPIEEISINKDESLFIKEILTEKKSIYVPDITTDNRIDKNNEQLQNVKSILGVPVVIEKEVFAVILIHNADKKIELTEDQITVIEALVKMASIAIQNSLLFDRKQLLLDLTSELSRSLSIRDIVQICFNYIDKVTGLPDTAIFLLNQSTGTLFPYTVSDYANFTEEYWKNSYKQWSNITPEKVGVFQEVINKKNAVQCYDVATDKLLGEQISAIGVQDFGIKSMLFTPLIAKGSIFGIAITPSLITKRKFTKNEVELCQSICNATAMALSNAIYADELDRLVKERTFELQQSNLKLEKLVQELKNLNEIKNDFIASLSHELRTPITAIKGMIDLLLMGKFGEKTDTEKNLLSTANRAATRLLNQVNDLLDFAKIDSGKVELFIEENSIHDVIEEAVQTLDPLIRKKQHTVVVENNVDVLTCFDRQRILQVLINLISNAIKFTDDFGTITVKSYSTSNEIVISVHDNGIGVSEENKKNIFSKFYQVNSQFSGTGLGLAISKQLIELHKGSISFESAEGQGSVFIVTFPIDKHNKIFSKTS